MHMHAHLVDAVAHAEARGRARRHRGVALLRRQPCERRRLVEEELRLAVVCCVCCLVIVWFVWVAAAVVVGEGREAGVCMATPRGGGYVCASVSTRPLCFNTLPLSIIKRPPLTVVVGVGVER